MNRNDTVFVADTFYENVTETTWGDMLDLTLDEFSRTHGIDRGIQWYEVDEDGDRTETHSPVWDKDQFDYLFSGNIEKETYWRLWCKHGPNTSGFCHTERFDTREEAEERLREFQEMEFDDLADQPHWFRTREEAEAFLAEVIDY